MAWGTVNVDEQRMRFVVSASRGEKSMRELCEEFEISRPTGYEWLRRYKADGIAGVVERSRRPWNSPRQTTGKIEERVIELREQRPDWGARKLQVLLRREGIHLPVITVHRILLRRGLVREQDRFRAAVERFQRRAPNQLWQMDFKSPIGLSQSASLLGERQRGFSSRELFRVVALLTGLLAPSRHLRGRPSPDHSSAPKRVTRFMPTALQVLRRPPTSHQT
jgi:transposase